MKIVIIGSSHAGLTCAIRAREEYPEAEIVIFEKQKEIAFVSQVIPFYLLGDKGVLDHHNYTSVENLRAQGFVVHNETTVVKIDVNTKEVFYRSPNLTEMQSENYDKLVLATGSYPVLPPIDSHESERIYTIKFMKDGEKLKKLLDTAKRVVIIGGGIIGVDLARIYNNHGVKVTLIQAHNRILNRYIDEEVSRSYEAVLEAEGIDVQLDTIAIDIRDQGDETVVYTDSNQHFAADGVIFTAGFRPNSYLLRNQAALGDLGAVKVDEYMQTSAADVFAVGDCATTYLNLTKQDVYLPHASDALRTGSIAAVNLTGEKQKIAASNGTFFIPISGMSLAVTGLTLETALANGYDAELVRIDKAYLSGEAGGISCWLTYEKGTHKILGLQAKGTMAGVTSSVAAYADLYSLAIQQEMTVEEIEFTDFYFRYGFSDPKSINQIFAAAIRKREREEK